MRSGMCLLTTCGLVCLALGGITAVNTVQAQEPNTPPEQFTRQKNTAQFFPRGGTPTQPEAAPKNYSQLFDSQPALKTSQKIGPGTRTESAFQQAAPMPIQAELGQPMQENPWRAQTPPVNTTPEAPSEPGQVINAEFNRSQDTSEFGQIEQAEGTNPFARPTTPSDAVNPFANPQPGAPQTAATQPQPERTANRLTITRPASYTPDNKPQPANLAPATPSEFEPAQPAQPTAPTAPVEGYEEPAAEAEAPTVTVEWVKRSNINVGQECQCDLVVRNTSRTTPASDVVVETRFPTTVRLTNSDPQPTESMDLLVWKFAALKPGETQTIHISMIPSERGELATQTAVRYTGIATGTFNVEEPLLQVALTGPQEVMVGDPASQLITISNPGTGVANNVTVEALIPAGLEHPRGQRLIMEIGSLNPNETRKLKLALAAVEGGSHEVRIQATADGNLKQLTASKVNVVAPSLAVVVDGPGLRYKGRHAEYTVSVKNEGAATSNNVRVMHKIPDGFTFVKADRGGKYDYTTKVVSWFIGRLEPGQTADVKLDLVADKIGDHVHYVAVASEHGTKSEAQVKTSVEGSAALVLEILDLDDPVEVGVETAYEIRVRNDGTKEAQNVGVSCELANGVRLVSAKGPSEFVAENGLVVFKSLPTLAPGKVAVFRVQVQGTVGGNHRFRARLASDSIQEPLIFEELTKFYTDSN